MTWTHFWDMNSGGGQKEEWKHIFIEAPEDEAKRIFFARFGHNPERVTCTCCGDDYSISEGESLAQLTGYHRNLDSLETPKDPETGRYVQPDDPWFKAHYYLEPGEEEEARRRGYEVRQSTARSIGIRYPESEYSTIWTVEEYVKKPDVLVIPAAEIKPEERGVDVPEQGYVWAG